MSTRTPFLLAVHLAVCVFSAQRTFAWDVGGPASFSDVLRPDGAASLADYNSHREADTIKATFTEATRRNCYRSPGFAAANGLTDTTAQYQSGLTCNRRKSDVFDFSTVEVGTFISWSPDYIEIIPFKLGKAGTFIAWCTLDRLLGTEEASCGKQPDEADQIRLSITGGIYYVQNAIVSSYPRGPARDGSCYDPQFYPRTQRPSRADNTTHPGDDNAQGAERQQAPNTERQTPAATSTPGSGLYRVQFVKVLYGVVTVATSVRGVSVENGRFELVSEAGQSGFFPVPVTEAEAAGQYIYDPFEYKFTLLKSDARQYY